MSAIAMSLAGSKDSPSAFDAKWQKLHDIPLDVLKAEYSMSPTSTSFGKSRGSPLRSYAPRSPPKYRMVLSKRLTVHVPALCLKSMVIVALMAWSNSSYRPMIQRVSSESTKVADQLQNCVFEPPERGMRPSAIQA